MDDFEKQMNRAVMGGLVLSAALMIGIPLALVIWAMLSWLG